MGKLRWSLYRWRRGNAGFVGKVEKHANEGVTFTHCMIHTDVLAAK